MNRFGQSNEKYVGPRTSLPRWRKDMMNPLELQRYIENGGVFRSTPGAPLSARDTTPQTGLTPDRAGGSTEKSWRAFFGEKGRFAQPAMPVRPVPDAKNPMVTNPNAFMADTHPGWAKDAQKRTSYQDPWLNQAANGTSADSPQNPSLLGQRDPSAALPSPAATPDLSTPDGLIADATNTSSAFLGLSAPPDGTIATPYGNVYSHVAGDSLAPPSWADELPTI